MRYRRSTYRHAMVMRSGQAWPFGDIWSSERLRLLAQTGWRPDVDASETAATVEVTLDLAGVDEDDVDIQLFEDALVVEGRRRLPSCKEGAVYHAAGIRQGPFRVELPLPAPVDPDGVQAVYERGLLHVTLPKRVTGA